MSGNVFLDTNVLLYCFDERDLHKQQVARQIVSSLVKSKCGRISTQNLQEFYNAVTKKLKCDKEALRPESRRVFSQLELRVRCRFLAILCFL